MTRSFALLALAATLMTLAASLLAGCSSDAGQAGQISRDAEALRAAVIDQLRQATAAVDNQLNGLSQGAVSSPDQTEKLAASVTGYLDAARDDLSQRSDSLNQADQLDLGDSYRQYFSLLKSDNQRLNDAIGAAQAVPALLKREEYALAGWDEQRTQQVAGQARQMEQQINQLFTAADELRNQAEQLRQDRPDDFGG